MKRIMVAVCVPILIVTVPPEVVAGKRVTTWVDYYPQLAKIFAKPKMPWKCQTIRTGFGAGQPTVVVGLKGELIANAGSMLVHSTDGGRTWKALCQVPVDTRIPKGTKLMAVNHDGVGVTAKGTLLFQYTLQSNDGRPYESWRDHSYTAQMYIVRSANRGRTWSRRIQINPPAPFNCVGTGRARFARLSGDVIAIPMETWRQSRPGKQMPHSEWYFQAFVYRSRDDGRTWTATGSLGKYTCEADLLTLPSGRMLATARYQRVKLPDDPPELAAPEDMSKAVGGHSVFKQTVLVHSDDHGATWSDPRFVTGWRQQTGCLARLSNGTLLLPFGHKTEGMGQRFMVSYDHGQTWSRRVYQLHRGGLYASSVVLADDTVVTVHDNRGGAGGSGFTVLHWRIPSRQDVGKGGFFNPPCADIHALPPTISSVTTAEAPTAVNVVFSKRVERKGAGQITNYHIDNGVVIHAATVQSDDKTVILSTSPLANGIGYTLTGRDVAAKASPDNTIAAHSHRVFMYSNIRGLVGYWNFDESGSPTAIDWSGYGHDGILLNGADLAAGALRLDGVDDYVDLGSADIACSEAITLSAWVRLRAMGGSQFLLTKDNGLDERSWNFQFSALER